MKQLCCILAILIAFSVSINSMAYSLTAGEALEIKTNAGDDSTIQWGLKYNGDDVPMSGNIEGSLSNNGGTISFLKSGVYTLVAFITDVTGRIFSCSRSVTVIEEQLNCDFSIQSTNLHLSKSIVVTMDSASHTGDKNIVWSLTRSSSAAGYTGTLSNSGGSINVSLTGSYTLKASITDSLGQTVTCSKTFSTYNNPPSIPFITRTPNGALLNAFDSVSINATATDPDGDSVSYTWENRSGSYPEGTHTVRCKAADKWGSESAWASIAFSTAYKEQTINHYFKYPNETRYIYQLTPKKYIKHITINIPSFNRQAGDFHQYYINLFDEWGNKDIEYTSGSFSSQQVIELDFPYKQYLNGDIGIYTNIPSLDGKLFTYKITYHD